MLLEVPGRVGTIGNDSNILTAMLAVVLLYAFWGDDLLGLIGGTFVTGATVLLLMSVGDAIHGSLGVSDLPFVFLRPTAEYPNGQLNPDGYPLFGLVFGLVMGASLLASAWQTRNRSAGGTTRFTRPQASAWAAST